MTATLETTADRSAAIRHALKLRGWSGRDVSVKTHNYSMGSSIRVSIINPAVSFDVVEDIANAHESIDRDQFGDILSGGNRYVFVSYNSIAEDAIRTRYADVFASAAADLAAGSANTLHPIGDTGFLLGRGSNGWGFSLWKDGHISEANEAIHLAPSLHRRIVS
jgi:hypothetical protein